MLYYFIGMDIVFETLPIGREFRRVICVQEGADARPIVMKPTYLIPAHYKFWQALEVVESRDDIVIT